eukprot:1430097-Rhodomonas_salina.3
MSSAIATSASGYLGGGFAAVEGADEAHEVDDRAVQHQLLVPVGTHSHSQSKRMATNYFNGYQTVGTNCTRQLKLRHGFQYHTLGPPCSVPAPRTS